MVWLKPLFILFGPPAVNWIVGRMWMQYRELRLHRSVFFAWLIIMLPIVLGLINGVSLALSSRGTAVAGEYPLRPSYYNPQLGGTNCDEVYDIWGRLISGDCNTMASGDKVTAWIGGQNGVYAAACANRPDLGWVIGSAAKGTDGTRFEIAGMRFECRDTGGWIQCYEPGEVDKAIANAHTRGKLLDQPAVAEEPYCWVDTMTTEPLAPYGTMIPASDWHMIVDDTIAPVPTSATGDITIETAVALLYADSEPWMTQGWHPSAGLPAAQDWKAGCGTPLYSPVPGQAIVTYNGDDGLGNGTTMITIDGAGGKVTLLHGNYTVRPGTAVIGGKTQIGTEASNGNSTGCHNHVIVYP